MINQTTSCVNCIKCTTDRSIPSVITSFGKKPNSKPLQSTLPLSGFWKTCVILYFIKELLDKICKAEKDIDSSFLKKGCTTEMSDLTTNPEAVSNFNKVIKPVSESIKLIGLHTEGSMKQKV